MPRTTGPTQRVRPAATRARVANFQAATPRAAAAPRASITASSYQAPAASATAQPHAAGCCCTVCTGLECLDRTRFFAGQLLSEADLNNEQSYWMAKSRLHNRFLQGWGVVCGLKVSCSDCEGWVNIGSGYAIDPCGNDVIVCQSQSFNVLQAIQACCTPKTASDCSPLRYRPAPTCQDAIQTWCISIEYQEQSSRMVTPLQTSPQATTCGCTAGCGCSSGCSCGCSGGTSSGQTKNSSTSCSCATANASSTAACEATRIVEGFKLSVCQTPEDQADDTPRAGTFDYQLNQCYLPLKALVAQKPTLFAADGTTPVSNSQAYQATCQYLASVKRAIAAAGITHCSVETKLDAISIPAPSGDGYVALMQSTLNDLAEVLHVAALDCVCAALLPPCSADPCDKRLVLACVTVQNGSITNICHFGGGRRQVITFPTLSYWLSIFGLDKLMTDLSEFLEDICCSDAATKRLVLGTNLSQRTALSTGTGNPAMVNQVLAGYLAQKLGASMVNSLSPAAQTVDLRPLVGMDLKRVLSLLDSYNVGAGTITQTDVSTDASWTESAIAAGASYSPAAFNPGNPLTVFTRGSVVVGLQVTSPNAVLSAQIAALQQQVNDLSAQIGAQRNAVGPATTSPKKR